jgi:putative transposase
VAGSLRIEFADALYSITVRGHRQEPIYADPEDRDRFLRLLGAMAEYSKWLCHAYCLMSNHYRRVAGTPEGNLPKAMRQLNGVYAQAYNRRHRQVGHRFQDRYKAILSGAGRYLLEADCENHGNRRCAICFVGIYVSTNVCI